MAGDHQNGPCFARSIGEAVRDGAHYLADRVAGLFRGIKGIAPLMLAIGCENARVETKATPSAAVHVMPEVQTPAETEPKALGRFNMTFYYVVGEVDVMAKMAKLARKAAANSNRSAGGVELASVTPSAHDKVTLYQGKTCKPIADVSKEFAAQLALQGTGKLKDGRILNVWGRCNCDHSPCFKETGTKWGTGGTGRGLQPFRTVAVDRNVIKLGSLLHVPALEGVTMPGRAPWGGFVHDGCVIADDTGGGIKGKQLDLFVGRKTYVDSLSRKGGSHAWARRIEVFDGSKLCERNGRKVGRKVAAI